MKGLEQHLLKKKCLMWLLFGFELLDRCRNVEHLDVIGDAPPARAYTARPFDNHMGSLGSMFLSAVAAFLGAYPCCEAAVLL